MTRTALMLALITGLFTVPAHAMTGNDLKKYCAAPESFNAGVCNGFIAAVHDTIAVLELASEKKTTLYCLPTGVTKGQSTAIVTKYLAARPEALHESAASLVLVAFGEAFPCR